MLNHFELRFQVDQIKNCYAKKMSVNETRKIRKPLMEKKRRARINDSLDTLKSILIKNLTTQIPVTVSTSSAINYNRTTKLEKADILEMTVKYVERLHEKLAINNQEIVSSTTNNEYHPGKLTSSNDSKKNVKRKFEENKENNNVEIPMSFNDRGGEKRKFSVVKRVICDNENKNNLFQRSNHWRPW